jgi:hypothetical protein
MLNNLAATGWTILLGVGALVGGILAASWRGASRERQRQERRHARDYQDKRREIDNADLGIGASDDQRIERLREIAQRRGSAGRD